MRRPSSCLLLLAAVALVTGCATVPTSGPIRNGSQDGLAPAKVDVAVEAQKPRANVDQLAIVNGFLEAMSDSRAYDVASEYLTAGAAAKWRPESKISVYDQTASKAVSTLADGTIELAAPLVGTIDSRGSWTPAPANQPFRFVFKLAKVSGQWRIANVPSGVLLGTNQLQNGFEVRNLYYWTPDRNMLVPDPVFLPRRPTETGQIATLLVQELLKGPTSRLGNGVATAAPPGTEVNVSVPVDLDVATVALSDEAASLGEPERRQLAAQILWTLRPVSSRVRITVNGAALIPDEEDALEFGNFSQYDPAAALLKQLYVIRKGKVQQVTGLDGSANIDALPLNSSRLYQFDARSLAVSLRGDYGAVVAEEDGDDVVAFARMNVKDAKSDEVGRLDKIRTEGTVLRPSFDAQDRLWIVDRADSAQPRLRVRSLDRRVTAVRTDFRGARPTVLRMAPDGVRALMVVERDGVTSAQTGTVAAGADKLPALGRIRPLRLPLQEITDASWYKTDEVLVAGASAKGQNRQPWEANTDGSAPRLVVGASDRDTIGIAASPNLDTQPVVFDARGRLSWLSKELTWQPVLEDSPPGSRAVYPG